MKAAVFFGKHDLRVTETDIPPVKEKQVRVRVKYCGVCGTDYHIYNGDAGAAEVTPPVIIGHEFSGIVDAVGPGVKSVKVGDKVAVDPNDMCGECYFCRNGQAHFCRNFKGYGTTDNGGFAEYVIVPEKQVYKVPDSMPLQTAALAETVSCCVHGIDLCNLKPGQNVLIIGCGPTGALMLQLAKSAGAGKIIVSEIVKEKRELALKYGADVVVDPVNEDLAAVLKENAENVDCVIECAGTVYTAEQAINLAGKGAVVMLFGLTSPGDFIKIRPYDIFQKEITIRSSFINPYTFNRAINLLATGRVRTDGIISDIIPIDEISRVFEDPSYRLRGKVLISI